MNYHSLLRRSCALLLISMALIGCASTTPKITQDSRAGARFDDLKTYEVRGVNIQIQGLSDPAYISRILDQQFGLRNFYRSYEAPDLHVSAQIFSRTTQGAGTGIGVGIGVPIGRHAGVSLGTGQLLDGRKNVSAVLIIDVSRASNQELIWRGTAQNIPLDYFTLANEPKLTQLISDVVAQFPPTNY